MGSQSPGIRNFMKLKKKKKQTEEGQSEACSGNLTQPAEEDHKIPIGKEEEIGLKRQ